MLYAVCFTMLFNVSYCNVLRRFWRQIASFQEGEILSFLIFRFKLLKNRYKIFTGNHDRILRKSIKKLVPSGSQIIKKQSKMGSRRDLGPSGGPSRSPGGLGVDFWLILLSILGSILELKFIKIIKNRFGRILRAQNNWTCSWMASNIDFQLILESFWSLFEVFFVGGIDCSQEGVSCVVVSRNI